MSSIRINVQFSIARAKARELKELASEIRTMANRQYSDTLNQIAANWKGNSANAYINKANHLKQKLLDTARRMDRAASDILASVKNMEEAERKANEIARLRNYHK